MGLVLAQVHPCWDRGLVSGLHSNSSGALDPLQLPLCFTTRVPSGKVFSTFQGMQRRLRIWGFTTQSLLQHLGLQHWFLLTPDCAGGQLELVAPRRALWPPWATAGHGVCLQRPGLSLLCRLHPPSFPRSLCSPLPATAGAQAPLPEVSTWPPGGHGLEAPREMVPAPAALFAPLSCSLSGFLHPPSPLKLTEASAMGLGAACPGTKAALQGKNWSPSELGNVPGKREVSFSWRSDTESHDAPGGGWLWEGKQGMVNIGIPLQLQAALWVHPVRRGAVGTQMGRDAG